MQIFFLLVLMSISFVPLDFKSTQLRHDRVKEAYEKKEAYLHQLLKERNIDVSKLSIYIRVFKKEGELEVWVKNNHDLKYQILKTYRICHASGVLGPKRLQGDRQVPEGFYHVDRFNPNSRFHLSLGINYPNVSDKVLSHKENPGGDIFIHGGCVSVGCLSMTDDQIKEIYVLSVESKNSGSGKIPVTIFPYRMNDEQHTSLCKKYKENTEVMSLWSEMKVVYDFFEKQKSLPKIIFEPNGRHRVI